MRKIILHTAAADRRGHFRDAGETLTVGPEDQEDADIGAEKADELVSRGGAVEDGPRDPLDHDGDGRKGGALGGKAKG